MKSINVSIAARFTIKTSQLSEKIYYESAKVCHVA